MVIFLTIYSRLKKKSKSLNLSRQKNDVQQESCRGFVFYVDVNINSVRAVVADRPSVCAVVEKREKLHAGAYADVEMVVASKRAFQRRRPYLCLCILLCVCMRDIELVGLGGWGGTSRRKGWCAVNNFCSVRGASAHHHVPCAAAPFSVSIKGKRGILLCAATTTI